LIYGTDLRLSRALVRQSRSKKIKGRKEMSKERMKGIVLVGLLVVFGLCFDALFRNLFENDTVNPDTLCGDESQFANWETTDEGELLQGYSIRTVYLDEGAKRLWMGGVSNVRVLDVANNLYEVCPVPIAEGKTVNSIILYRGDIYVATDQDWLWRWNGESWTQIKPTDSEGVLFDIEGRYYDLYVHEDKLVVAGFTGMLEFDGQNWSSLTVGNTTFNELPDTAPRDIHAVIYHQYVSLWYFASRSNGLVIYDEEAQSWIWHHDGKVFKFTDGEWEEIPMESHIPQAMRDLDVRYGNSPAIIFGGDDIEKGVGEISYPTSITTHFSNIPSNRITGVEVINQAILATDWEGGAYLLNQDEWQTLSILPSFDSQHIEGQAYIATAGGLLRVLLLPATCGNGICQTGEENFTCPVDCGTMPPEATPESTP
jgi:hypothetical protein